MSANGKVQLLLDIKGQDNASESVGEVKKSLGDMFKVSEEGWKHAAEVSGDLEKGLLGLKDITGDLPAPLQAMADAFGGAEKILTLMPGPLGVIGASIYVAANGAYIFYDNLAKSEAKMKLLGGERAGSLKENLGLSVDEAVKLSQALGDLPENLKPTDRELGVIIKRAKSLGLEGGEAAQKYAEALSQGPKALQDFEKEFGKLGEKAINLPDISKQLGLDESAINKANETVDLAKQATDARDAAQTAQIRLNELQQQQNEFLAEYQRKSLATREDQKGKVKAIQAEVDAAGELVDKARAEFETKNAALKQQQVKDKAKQDADAITKQAAADIALKESEIALITNKTAKAKAENVLAGIKLGEIDRQRIALQEQLNQKIITEQEYKLGIAALETQQNQLIKQKREEDKAKAQAAADKRKQQLAAETAAVAKVADLRASSMESEFQDTERIYEFRVAAIQAQTEADIKAARKEEGTAKTKAARVDAIRLESAAKIRKLQEDLQAQTVKDEQDNQRRDEDRAKFAEETTMRILKAKADAAVTPEQKEQTKLEIARMERLKAMQDLETAGIISSEDIAKRRTLIETEYTVKATGFAKERKDAEEAAKKTQQDSVRDQRLALLDLMKPAADLAKSYSGNKGIGNAMAAAVDQGKLLVANWDKQKSAASGIIGAVGQTAAAFVDGEKQKAAILALMETAQAVVSFAAGDIAGGVAHTTAAGLYGAVAGGLIGTAGAGGAGAGAASGGGGFAATGGGGAGGGAATGPATTVINFNAPLGTAYEIGKSVVKAQKAAGGSGWSPAMAMGV